MKYVVYNGMNAECTGSGQFGAACPIYSSDGVSEVIRTTGGNYVVYWNDPYPNNDYTIIATSNGNGVSGAFASLGGNDDSTDANYGISVSFVEIQTRVLGTAGGETDSDYISVVAHPNAFDVCSIFVSIFVLIFYDQFYI